MLLHTAQSQAIMGTPLLVPVPKNVILISGISQTYVFPVYEQRDTPVSDSRLICKILSI
ncbi:MAG: hypothetical protein LBE82_04115 [Chitinophagaceae bacterium]|nr:hypothetical protein [Chitinophagaceae bacterium]